MNKGRFLGHKRLRGGVKGKKGRKGEKKRGKKGKKKEKKKKIGGLEPSQPLAKKPACAKEAFTQTPTTLLLHIATNQPCKPHLVVQVVTVSGNKDVYVPHDLQHVQTLFKSRAR